MMRDIKGKKMVRWEKSDQAKEWENLAILQLARQKRMWETATQSKLPFKTPCVLSADIYYRSGRSDLSDEMLCDTLQRAGVIENDRLFVVKHLFRHEDKTNPRVECWIEPLDDSWENIS